MAEAGSYFLAEIMLWLIYITLFIAIASVLVSAIRSFWMDNLKK